jgi:hypothetical protein
LRGRRHGRDDGPQAKCHAGKKKASDHDSPKKAVRHAISVDWRRRLRTILVVYARGAKALVPGGRGVAASVSAQELAVVASPAVVVLLGWPS